MLTTVKVLFTDIGGVGCIDVAFGDVLLA